MELQPLKVKVREQSGKGPARQTRMRGDIPGVVYGEGKAPMSVTIELRAFEHIVHSRAGENAIIQLEVEGPGEGGPAILREVQHHPVRNTVIHADLLRIRLDEKIQTAVPLVLTGRSKGVIEGGLQDHQLHELEIECLALEAPLEFKVDISHLGIGDSLHVSDLDLPANLTVLTEADRGVVSIHAPRLLKEDADEDAAVAAAADAAVEGEDESAEDATEE